MMPSRSCSGVKVAERAGLKAMRAGFSNGDRAPTSRPGGPCTLVGSCGLRAGRKRGTDEARGAGRQNATPRDARRLHQLFLPDLAGVEDAVRIERGLDPLHQGDDLGRQLQADVGRLREADAVLAADRSLEADDALEERAGGGLRAAHLVGVGGIHHDVDVNVAVAGVAEARNPAAGARVRAATPGRTAAARARAAPTTSWLILRGAAARSAYESSRRASQSRCRSPRRGRASHRQGAGSTAGVFDQRQLPRRPRRRRRRPRPAAWRPCPAGPRPGRGAFHRAQRASVDELDGGGHDARLEKRGDARHGGGDVAEAWPERGARRRLRDQPQRDLGDDRQRALGSHEQLRQVVADDVLHRLGAGADDLAGREHRLQRQDVAARGAVLHRARASGALRDVAAQGRDLQAGRIRRIEQPACLDGVLQLAGEDVGLHHGEQVLAVDLEDAVEALHRQQHPAAHRAPRRRCSRCRRPGRRAGCAGRCRYGRWRRFLDGGRQQHQVGGRPRWSASVP